MEIAEEVVQDKTVQALGDNDNNFNESIIGKEITSDEEPVPTPKYDPEPEGGVEIPAEEESKQVDPKTIDPGPPQKKDEPVDPKGPLPVSKFEVDKADYDTKMARLAELEQLAPHWDRFRQDPPSFLKELGIEVKTSEKSYDQEHDEEYEKIRSEFGEDFEIASQDLVNPKSDSAKFLKKIGDMEFALRQKHAAASQGMGQKVQSSEELWKEANTILNTTVQKAVKDYNIKESDVVAAYREIHKVIAGTNDDKKKIILLANLATELYTKAQYGLKNKVTVQKIEDQIAAEGRKKLTPTPASQKSQNRSGATTVNPFDEDGSGGMFRQL